MMVNGQFNYCYSGKLTNNPRGSRDLMRIIKEENKINKNGDNSCSQV